MSHRNLLVGLVLMSLFPVASRAAATSPPGVNLRWDQCYADAGVWNKQFACDTNTGSDRLVMSFELAVPKSDVSGIEFAIDIASEGTLPAWWQLRNSGTCRQTALSMTALPPPGAVNCADWAQGQAAGAIGAYTIGTQGPSTSRIIGAVAVPANVSLGAGTEYAIGTISINHQKTVGTGSCAGCVTPVCIFFSHAYFTTPVSENNLQLYYGANWLGSQYATWQNGYPINIQQHCSNDCNPPFLHNRRYYSMDCVLSTPTRSRGSTWGEVKSLYR